MYTRRAMTTARTRKRSRPGGPGSDPFKARAARVRSALRALGVDALLVTNANDIRYVTGFSGEDSWALVGATSTAGLTVVSDFRFQEELEAVRGRAAVLIRKGLIAPAAVGLIKDLRLKRVGVQSEHLTAAARREIATSLGAKGVVDTTGVLSGLRVIKDESEIRLIRKAVSIQESAMQSLLRIIRPGMKESEVAALLEYGIKSRGADGTSFETNVSARANGSKPHYRPGPVTLKNGTPLLIDWGARVDGYCSDMTRTFHFGRWSERMRDIYEIVLEAHLAAIDAIRPGVEARRVDQVARDIIARAGYAEQFGHGLGHGIGLNIHEAPRLAASSETVLRPGMVVTVEPGIYLPGIGGVRIEDDILVTERGRRNLCTLPKDLKWATLHG